MGKYSCDYSPAQLRRDEAEGAARDEERAAASRRERIHRSLYADFDVISCAQELWESEQADRDQDAALARILALPVHHPDRLPERIPHRPGSSIRCPVQLGALGGGTFTDDGDLDIPF